ACRDLGERDRGLVRFGAARGEEGLVELARREADELLGQIDDPEGRVERRDVPEAVDLRVERGVHALVRLAEADGEDATEEIEVAPAVEILEARALAALEDDALLVVVRDAGEEKLLVPRPDVGARGFLVAHSFTISAYVSGLRSRKNCQTLRTS